VVKLEQDIDELKKELESKKNRKFQEKCILIAQVLLGEEPIRIQESRCRNRGQVSKKKVKKLRKPLIEAVKKIFSNVRVVAVYWNHENRTPNEIIKITSERVMARGENHQNLTIENRGKMWNKEVIQKVLEEIKLYKPNVSVGSSISDSSIRKFKKRNAQYYGIDLSYNFQNFLTNFYKEHPNEDSGTFNVLVQNDRISASHHVTLIHSMDMRRKESLWKKYEKLCEGPTMQVKIFIDKIVFNSQIMALVVNKIDPPTIYSANKVAHVTVGTIHKSIKPVQSGKICESALFGIHEESDVRVINLEKELIVKGIVKAF
ncbi:2605_t:CDS:2, partial [Rhizophagus irregularis]